MEHVGLDEAGPIGQSGTVGHSPSLSDGGVGEVETGHASTDAREGEGVETEVTLQVHQIETVHVAERVELSWARSALLSQPPLDVVEERADVDRHSFVPVGAIGSNVAVHERDPVVAGRSGTCRLR